MNIYSAELVTNIFGYWPSFHDAEVVRLALERTTDYATGPVLLADVHAFEITTETDASGYSVLRHHTLVQFRFDGVQDLELAGFNNQNALSEIRFSRVASPAFPKPAFAVSLDAAHGVSASFRCDEVTVLGVQPWDVSSRAPAA